MGTFISTTWDAIDWGSIVDYLFMAIYVFESLVIQAVVVWSALRWLDGALGIE